MTQWLMDDYPELGGHLAANAAFVSNPTFEGAVSKIAKGHPISNEERYSVLSCLLKPVIEDERVQADVSDDIDGGDSTRSNELSYAQKVELRMKRRKSCNDDIATKYINLDVICGTSVECERLFSVAKNILTDTRKSTCLTCSL